VYNSLAASAFFLLALNPNNFFDTGFQLSYIAVISIVFFYPLINKLLSPKNKVISYLWSLTAVSIAAQIGTFSLTLFYFNQFPNYFLLSNLVAIPISTVAMYLSVFLIVVSPFEMVASFIGKLFSYSLWALNNSLKLIEELPYSVSNGIYIDSLQLVIILLVVTLIAIYYVRKSNIILYTILSSLILFQSSWIIRVSRNFKKEELVVYRVSNNTLFSIKAGSELKIISNDSTKVDINNKYGFFIKGYLNAIGNSKNFEAIFPKVANSEMEFKTNLSKNLYVNSLNGKTIGYLYGKSMENMQTHKPLSIDILIIDKSSPENSLQLFNPKLIVIASSMAKWKVEKIKIQCIQKGIAIHNVATQGAFIQKN
jgi:competence protein ComEC